MYILRRPVEFINTQHVITVFTHDDADPAKWKEAASAVQVVSDEMEVLGRHFTASRRFGSLVTDIEKRWVGLWLEATRRIGLPCVTSGEPMEEDIGRSTEV